MGPFLVVFDPSSRSAQRTHDEIESALSAAGWRARRIGPHLQVLQQGPLAPAIEIVDGGVLLGDAFARTSASAPQGDGARAALLARAQHIRDTRWGRFVAILTDPGGRLGVYRDPSGALDAFVWQAGGVVIAGSVLPPGLPAAFQPNHSVDWDEIGRLLRNPVDAQAVSCLRGVASVAPGGLAVVDRTDVRAIPLWTPAEFAGGRAPGFANAAKSLRETVDDVLGCYASAAAPVLAEVSGGFDSAVVASGLQAHGATIAALINYAASTPGGDERPYARSLAERLGVRLEIRQKSIPDFSPASFSPGAAGLRPSFSSFDEAGQRDLRSAADELGVQKVFTGHAGDAVFFQITTPVVMRDRVLRLGPLGLFSSETPRIARWSRRSAYKVIAVGLGRYQVSPPEGLTPAWIRADLPSRHPWLMNLDRVGPAKRLQIEALAHAGLRHGTTRLTGVVDVVHPLLAQPILEHSLSVPADVFVRGGRGRALARAAFGDRLPDTILQRRSKGELGPFYGAAAAAALPAMRDFLLGGLLAERGLIDRDQAGSALDETLLAERAPLGFFLRALALEAWARRWS